VDTTDQRHRQPYSRPDRPGASGYDAFGSVVFTGAGTIVVGITGSMDDDFSPALTFSDGCADT
jgi:hypothetical protein